ncbi:alpha/beta-hydrolase N-terminal domain-containing protein [Arthrobacter antioxidans]|uniref:alpha/beta-hydrolase N-terminal domain-containing protein n=1 Tax=Arthrobacter antioxidans TaxID=2895818 RepID=UPI0020000C49|nr:alpha/beta-hydrolase N-terminal domain-containing protein [Arthrobacter antioxidans]
MMKTVAIFRRSTAYFQAHLVNLVCALGLASLALTPSLVPRPTVFQGFLAGLWFMIGFQSGPSVIETIDTHDPSRE